MVLSLLAEMLPTWAISDRSRVDFDSFWSSDTTFSTALSMPRFTAMGS